MILLKEVEQSEVWEHWKKVENFSSDDFRSDIRGPLPKDLKWHLAEIEKEDLDKMFNISSTDWTDISAGTFKVLTVVSRINSESDNPDTERIRKDILEKLEFIKKGGVLDTKLIAVTSNTDLKSPFTFIEGNRRCVTMCANNSLIGNQIYIGISPEITSYSWAKKSVT